MTNKECEITASKGRRKRMTHTHRNQWIATLANAGAHHIPAAVHPSCEAAAPRAALSRCLQFEHINRENSCLGHRIISRQKLKQRTGLQNSNKSNQCCSYTNRIHTEKKSHPTMLSKTDDFPELRLHNRQQSKQIRAQTTGIGSNRRRKPFLWRRRRRVAPPRARASRSRSPSSSYAET